MKYADQRNTLAFWTRDDE